MPLIECYAPRMYANERRMLRLGGADGSCRLQTSADLQLFFCCWLRWGRGEGAGVMWALACSAPLGLLISFTLLGSHLCFCFIRSVPLRPPCRHWLCRQALRLQLWCASHSCGVRDARACHSCGVPNLMLDMQSVPQRFGDS